MSLGPKHQVQNIVQTAELRIMLDSDGDPYYYVAAGGAAIGDRKGSAAAAWQDALEQLQQYMTSAQKGGTA